MQSPEFLRNSDGKRLLTPSYFTRDTIRLTRDSCALNAPEKTPRRSPIPRSLQPTTSWPLSLARCVGFRVGLESASFTPARGA